MAEGAWGPLRSVTPNLTPPGWTTAFTGVNPGKHGIFDFFTMDPGAENPRVISSVDRKAPALWEILGPCGRRVGVFNVPTTYPADKVPGFFITGMGTPGLTGPWVHPEGEKDELRREFPAFRIGADHHLIEKGDYDGFLDELYALTDTQERLVLKMVERHDPSALIFIYDDLDRVMHFYWRFMERHHPRFQSAPPRIANAIRDYYRRIEEGIGRLLAAMGPDTDLVHPLRPRVRPAAHGRLLEPRPRRRGAISEPRPPPGSRRQAPLEAGPARPSCRRVRARG